MNKEIIIHRLIDDFPQLKEEVNESLRDFPQIYLHLIFGDVFNPYLNDLLEEPLANFEKLLKAGKLLEYMLQCDEKIQEVVVTTVLERLSDEPKKMLVFWQFAGDTTRKYIGHIL